MSDDGISQRGIAPSVRGAWKKSQIAPRAGMASRFTEEARRLLSLEEAVMWRRQFAKLAE